MQAADLHTTRPSRPPIAIHLMTILALIAGVLGLSVATASPAGAAPAFALPFTCGDTGWLASTRADHVPSTYAIDFNKAAGDAGLPVRTSAAGTIVRNPYASSSNPIAIDHDGGGWRSGWATLYLHMTSSIANGATVQRGDIVGYVSDVGAPGQSHLHYEQRLDATVQPAVFTNWTPPYNAAMRTGLGVAVPASDNCSGASPIGHFDVVSSPEAGRIRVGGWTFDPDAPTQPISVHVYVGGPAGSGEGHNIGAASGFRPDIASVHPSAGPNHGFDATVTTGRTGSVAVYVYAINQPGTGGENALLGTRTVNVADLNRPGFVGGSRPWKRGWSHAEGDQAGEADDASVLRGGEGPGGAVGSPAAS